MKQSPPSIANTINELTKTLESMKKRKDNLDIDIINGEHLRDKLTQTLNQYIDEYNKVSSSLEQKKSVLQVYDKIINESDSAFSKIVQSTEALFKMVKTEEKKMTTTAQI